MKSNLYPTHLGIRKVYLYKMLHMKKFLLLPVFLFTFFHSNAEDCTCVGSLTFCEAITDDNGDIRADIIVRGTFKGYDGGVKVGVNQILYGDTIQNDLIITLSICDYNTIPLVENDEYVFAVEKFDSSYFFIFCSISYLKIEDEVVTGLIAPGIESIDYPDLKTLDNCGEYFDPVDIAGDLSVFPNPTHDILKVKNTSSSNTIENVQIEFIDMIGRELYTFKKEDEILGGEIWTINLQSFSAGVYFLKLTADNKEWVVRIVKQ